MRSWGNARAPGAPTQVITITLTGPELASVTMACHRTGWPADELARRALLAFADALHDDVIPRAASPSSTS